MPRTSLTPENLPALNLPPAAIRLRQGDEGLQAFDRHRRKWVLLTPEEWVRLNFTAWLHGTLHYPDSTIANEIGIKVNDTRRRCDTVVFVPHLTEPLMIVEYKAPTVKITQDVFDQIVRYNMTLKARYLVVSNGMAHYCCVMDYTNDTYHFIPAIPDYRELQFGNSEN